MRATIETAALWAALLLFLTGPATEAHAAASSTRQAPVGHRQPTAEDVEGVRQDNSADQAMKKIDDDLDKNLKGICRGC